MPLLFVLLAFLTACAPSVWGFDLPEIIGEFYRDNNVGTFVCIGDQNGDGSDDLLATFLYSDGYEIHFGGNEMGDSADYFISFFREYEDQGNVLYLGNLLPDYSRIFAIQPAIRNLDGTVDLLIDFHSGLDGQGNDSILTTWPAGTYRKDLRGYKAGHRQRPCDFNGDNYSDLVMNREISDSLGAIDVCFGGPDFDSIPDWTKYYSLNYISQISCFNSSSSYDLNADGYDDMLLQCYLTQPNMGYSYCYEVYFGGADPDTVPEAQIWERSFEREGAYPMDMPESGGAALIPDVNDDGYDDFGIYFSEYRHNGSGHDGFLLFFGGEEISNMYDMILPGTNTEGNGTLTGGDFNGDGNGDFAVQYFQTPPWSISEIHYFFGGADFDSLPDVVVTHHDYDGRYHDLGIKIGGVGDYNGDGADDLVAKVLGANGYNVRMVILAGSRRWDRSVPSSSPALSFDYNLQAFPNPFNGSTKISFSLSLPGSYQLGVFDITGRKIFTPFTGTLTAGDHSFNLPAQASGVYLAILFSGEERIACSKIVSIQ